MPNYRLNIAYDGTNYDGWQVQPGKSTIQGSLMDALSRLEGGREVKLTGAGRTDAGVHARGQVANVMLAKEWRPRELLKALNGNLTPSIAVLGADVVPDGFSARRDALWRMYRYRIIRTRDPLQARHAWLVEKELDVERMNQVAAQFLGRHDFTSFSSAPDDAERSMVRDMLEFAVAAVDNGYATTVRADGFLTHQVRFMVAMLVKVGTKQMSGDEAMDIFARRERGLIRGMAPAQGLCLEAVGYPDRLQGDSSVT
jgi:tRNA pseudouridine38-40 synthase